MKGIFQLVFIIVFIAGAIFGILVFSGAIDIGSDETQAGGTVVLWGTVKPAIMASLIQDFNRANGEFNVVYVEKSAENFDQNLLEALASGTGPDLFLLPDNLAFHYSNKIFPVPYTSYPLVTFKNTFAGGGDVFLTSAGILAFPLTIDPLVMYYNKSALDSNAITYPPKTWQELSTMVPVITKKDNSDKVIKSAVALGYFSNVVHAKDILVAMFMQAGNPIVSQKDAFPRAALDSTSVRQDLPSILQFFTDFADPAKDIYSWNRSFPSSLDAFIKEDLAFYFGFSSELRFLINRNPNLNLGVAPIPQMDITSKATNAKVTGVAISSASKNLTAAFVAASKIATTDFATKLALGLDTPPARRDLLGLKPGDAYGPIFFESALYGKSWLDPSPKATSDIFRTMIDSVLSNNSTATEAVSDANSKIDILLTNN